MEQPKSAFVLLVANLLLCIKNIKFYFILFFFIFLDCFDIMLVSKINFKKIKNIYYFNIFLNKKYFKK
jgi:hypothetical protein